MLGALFEDLVNAFLCLEEDKAVALVPAVVVDLLEVDSEVLDEAKLLEIVEKFA